jgi:hypothetical protein
MTRNPAWHSREMSPRNYGNYEGAQDLGCAFTILIGEEFGGPMAPDDVPSAALVQRFRVSTRKCCSRGRRGRDPPSSTAAISCSTYSNCTEPLEPTVHLVDHSTCTQRAPRAPL